VKVRLLAGACLLSWTATPAAAEWQFKPFVGAALAGATTFVDLEHAAGNVHSTAGVTALLLGNVFGVEGDVAAVPGFFESESRLVVKSRVTTLTGNLVVALPRQIAQYSLRPYFVVGGGLIHAHSEDFFGAVSIGSTLPATDVGAGVTGFLTNRFGVNWDVRYFRSVGNRDEPNGISFGPERLSFWRASMGLAIRY
jgi:hypothetical protein